MREIPLDDRRLLILPGSRQQTLDYAIDQFIQIALKAQSNGGFFSVALSGGSTPKAIYQGLLAAKKADKIDWKRVYLFWSDERAVPPTHPDSNYHMAMVEGGLEKLSIPEENIFRMKAEENIEANAHLYEELIRKTLQNRPFDLVMLGVGEDGHTASLFPGTSGLEVKDKLVVANYISQKKVWRMSFTFECINQASHIHLYVLGAPKAEIAAKVLLSETNDYPSSRVGTDAHPAQWILDDDASTSILTLLN